MRYKLHMAYANRDDLALEAAASVEAIGHIHVWPNGENADNLQIPRCEAVHWMPPMAPVSLINCMIKESWNDDVMFWMHNDALAKPGADDALLERVEELHASDKRWGVVFTCYDALCCFNMKMVRDVGYWDHFFFQYVSDVDFYRRMALKGWSEEYYLRDAIEHRGSASIKADPLLNHRAQFGIERARAYYAQKWGGEQGRETFTTPFAGGLRR
jgi:hypothetical protein